MTEWPMVLDCKSSGKFRRRFEPYSLYSMNVKIHPSVILGLLCFIHTVGLYLFIFMRYQCHNYFFVFFMKHEIFFFVLLQNLENIWMINMFIDFYLSVIRSLF